MNKKRKIPAKEFLCQTRRDEVSEGGVLEVRWTERTRKQRSMAQKGRAGGQAVMELIIVLPFLVFIILFGLQIFKAIYEAQVKQETAKVRLLSEKIQNRANGGIDMPPSEIVQETSSSIDTAGIPILTEEGVTPPISIKIGICRDINCGEGI